MEWEQLFDYQLTTNWQYSLPVRGRDFKVQFIYADVNRNSIILLALADVPSPNTTVESTEFFKPQQIKPLVESEIIRFAEPPKNWRYRIAVKKIPIPRQPLSETRIRFFMPAYSSAPASGGVTSAVTAATVAVDNTKSVTLSAANPVKIGSTVTNNSTKAKLYVSLSTAASLTNYDKILGYAETFETPFNWAGDVFGIWDKADTGASARIRDFS